MNIGERIIFAEIKSQEEYINYLFHYFSYLHVVTQVHQGSTILDLGCGDGYGTFLLSKHAKKVVGLDIDPTIISQARQAYTGNIEYDIYDGEKLPYNESTFDIVVSFQVIEHVDDVQQFLLEIQRVLKPGGTFYLSTPNRVHRLRPGQKPWNIYHKREYDRATLEQIIRKVFEVIQLQGIRGIEEIQKIELKRVNRNRLLASLDFMNLRTKIPDGIRIPVVSVISRILHSSDDTSEDFDKKFSVDDVFLTDDNIEDSLHFFVTCFKPR